LTAGPDCQTLERTIAALLDAQSRQIVIDGAKIGQIGSGAVRVLLRMSRKLQPLGGGLILCALSEKVRLALKISGFDQDFDIVNSHKEAVSKAAALTPTVGVPEPTASRRTKLVPVPPPAPSPAAPHPLRASVLRALAHGLGESTWHPSAAAATPSTKRGSILTILKQ